VENSARFRGEDKLEDARETIGGTFVRMWSSGVEAIDASVFGANGAETMTGKVLGEFG
jgi:hypothetical protein